MENIYRGREMFKLGLAGAAAVAMPGISAAAASPERPEVFRSALATLEKYLSRVDRQVAAGLRAGVENLGQRQLPRALAG